VYWIPLFSDFGGAGLEVCLVMPNMSTCARAQEPTYRLPALQYLHSWGCCGPFRRKSGLCHPFAAPSIATAWCKWRQRHVPTHAESTDPDESTTASRLSDNHRASGLAILDAILAGERNPAVLANYATRAYSEPEVITKSLGETINGTCIHLATVLQAIVYFTKA